MKFFIAILLMLLFLLILFYYFNKLEYWDSMNFSSFECGFYPLYSCRFSNSIPFFLTLLLFLFLDLELCMILPYFYGSLDLFLNINLVVFLNFFIMIGFFMEWFMGGLEWSN